MIGKLKTAAIAVFTAAIGVAASSSHAAVIVQSGSTYGGWDITTPAGISLVVDSVTSNTISLEKFAAFPNMEGLPITFTQVSANAVPLIDFANEQVTNLSGSHWSGFQYILANVSESLGAGAVTFQGPGSIFAPPVGYTGVSFTSNLITYTGSQANLATASWGFGADGDLIINANPSHGNTFTQDFVFKEQPLTNLVPLPAAGLQGLAGLLGLGLIASAKTAKKLMA